MRFELKCPSCHKAVTIASEVVGQLLACPHCSKCFNTAVPEGGGLPVAVAPPAAGADSVRRRFTFACQRCGSTLESYEARCGQPGRCPTCGAVFVVPAVDPNTGRAVGPAVVADDGQLPTPMHAYATAGSAAPQIHRRADGTQVIVCPRCRRQMPVDADTCGACGLPFTLEGTPSTPAPDPGENPLATAALTVGILAALSFCLPLLGPVAIGLGIAGWRKSNQVSQRGAGRSMAIAGIILGVVSIVLFVGARILGSL